MPIDFGNVPAKVDVPDPPTPAFGKWALLFIVIVGGGAALAVYLWPSTRQTNTAWFWICVIGYPMLGWLLLWSVTLASIHGRRTAAMGQNKVSETAEQACHAEASKPLALLAHAWRFSADETENGVDAVVNGRVTMGPRPSAAFPDQVTVSRWIAIPGRRFYPGNVLSEASRHTVVTHWLIDRLLPRIVEELERLPSNTPLRVRLVSASTLDPSEVGQLLHAKLRGWLPWIPITMSEETGPLSLFEIDTLADTLPPGEVQLLIALQLRRAISEQLGSSVAEAGVALLIGRPCASGTSATNGAAIHLHRPAAGDAEALADVVSSASSWGMSAIAGIGAAWNHGFSDEAVSRYKAMSGLAKSVTWLDLHNTVGDCGSAGPWLGVALAADHAGRSGTPQLLIAREDERVIALLCRKPS